MDADRTPSAAQCCDKVYFCPTSGETECPVHGGFDVCCDRPDLHRPVASAAKPPCLHPLPDGRRCCECDTCQGLPWAYRRMFERLWLWLNERNGCVG